MTDYSDYMLLDGSLVAIGMLVAHEGRHADADYGHEERLQEGRRKAKSLVAFPGQTSSSQPRDQIASENTGQAAC